MTNKEKARGDKRTQLGIEIIPEIEPIFDAKYGWGDKRVITHAALLMFHCSAPMLQMAFRGLYRDISEGRITLDDARDSYALAPSERLVQRLLGQPATFGEPDRRPLAQVPEPERPRKRKN